MNNREPQKPFQPVIKRPSGLSIIWLIPLVTLVTGIWLVYKNIDAKGPDITLSFNTAEGVIPGKTRIKYKNIDVGLVESVDFADGYKGVLLHIQMEKRASNLLRRDSRFWIVRPRLSLRGASGLGTLISGSYIELEPGEGAIQSHFIGLETPPVIKSDDAGKEIILQTDKLGSLDIGSPVYFRGIQAGEVQGYELSNDRSSVFVHVFIKSPFDDILKGNSRFWNVSGIDLSMTADGLNLNTESMQSILLGGIAFETPAAIEPSTADVEQLVFTLHENRKQIDEQGFSQKINFVLFFEGSVRGLSIGAPVEFKGIKVGRVIDIRLEFEPDDTSFQIPVLIEIEPERVITRGETRSPYDTLAKLVERGLRARLQTGSLLTGKLFVELDIHPDTPIRLVSNQQQIPELPTIPAEIEEITSSLKDLLAKVNAIDYAGISEQLLGTLSGTNALANSADLKAAIVEMKTALQAFSSVMTTLDPEIKPLSDQLAQTMQSGNDALQKIQVTLDYIDNLVKPDSAVQYSLQRSTDEISEAARSIKSFLEMLEDNPQALIFGRDNSE